MTRTDGDERWRRALYGRTGTAGFRSAGLRLNRRGHVVDGDAGLLAWLGYGPAELEGRHMSALVPALAGDALTARAHASERLTLFAEFAVTLKARDAAGTEVPCRLHVEGVEQGPEGPVLCIRLDEVASPMPAGIGTSRSPFPRPR